MELYKNGNYVAFKESITEKFKDLEKKENDAWKDAKEIGDNKQEYEKQRTADLLIAEVIGKLWENQLALDFDDDETFQVENGNIEADIDWAVNDEAIFSAENLKKIMGESFTTIEDALKIIKDRKPDIKKYVSDMELGMDFVQDAKWRPTADEKISQVKSKAEQYKTIKNELLENYENISGSIDWKISDAIEKALPKSEEIHSVFGYERLVRAIFEAENRDEYQKIILEADDFRAASYLKAKKLQKKFIASFEKNMKFSKNDSGDDVISVFDDKFIVRDGEVFKFYNDPEEGYVESKSFISPEIKKILLEAIPNMIARKNTPTSN